jgi:phosphonate transport system substrate-binding protein
VLTLGSFLADNARPVYKRITAYLAQRLGAPAQLVATGAVADRHRRLDAGEIQVAFICGLPYSEKRDRPDPPVELLCAPVMAAPRYGGQPVYFTDVVVRRDSPARDFTALRGATWAYNDEGSHSGYNVVRNHLLELGHTRGYFGRTVAAGAHQRALRMILDGEADAAGIDSIVLEVEAARHPGLAEGLRTIACLGPEPIPPVVVACGVPAPLKARLRELFLSMADDPAGRHILAAGRLARFVPVEDAHYDPIRAMVRRARAASFLALG